MLDRERHYKEMGFLHLPGFFPASTVGELIRQIHDVFASAASAKGLPVVRQADGRVPDSTLFSLFDEHWSTYLACMRAVQNLPLVFALGTQPRLLDALRELGLGLPTFSSRPIVTLSSKRTSKHVGHWKTPAHQDWRSIQGSLNGIVAWIPLLDVDAPLGRLEIAPKSHLLGLLDVEPDEWYMHIKQEDEKRIEFVPLDTRAGDLVLFSMFLVHRSGNNLKDTHRYALQYRYNDLAEPTFIARGYPTAYKADSPDRVLITPGLGSAADVMAAFGRQSTRS